MRAGDRLVELCDFLEWIKQVADNAKTVADFKQISEAVRIRLAENIILTCTECGKRYIYDGDRHYRCSPCRWKSYMIGKEL